jgi:hypothetical protein
VSGDSIKGWLNGQTPDLEQLGDGVGIAALLMIIVWAAGLVFGWWR